MVDVNRSSAQILTLAQQCFPVTYHIVSAIQIKAEDPTEMPPAPASAPAPAPAPPAQQTHLPQAQLMLAGSQLAGVSGGPGGPDSTVGLKQLGRHGGSGGVGVGVLWTW